MSAPDFPTDKDWDRIYQESLCTKFRSQLDPLRKSLKPSSEIRNFARLTEIRQLVWQLHYREADITKSFILLRYYFEKGIPDDEWQKSPGEDESSIQYLPNFEEKHFIIKDWFDYYADTFYHKLFSAWDTIGHMLNVYFVLGIKPERVYFPNAVSELKNTEADLWQKLDGILNSSVYQKAKALRNDITHNYLPSSLGLEVTTTRSGDKITANIGIRNYITSKEIMSNVSEILDLFQKSINVITER